MNEEKRERKELNSTVLAVTEYRVQFYDSGLNHQLKPLNYR